MTLANIQEPPERSLILLVGPPGAGKSTFCHQVVLNSVAGDRPVIFVTTEQSASDIISLLREKGLGETTPGAVSFVDAFSETVGVETPDRPDTIRANCADLNSISIGITKLRHRIGKEGVLLAFDSLTSPYLFSGIEVVRFMKLFLSKFVAEGNSVVVLIDEGCGKEEDLGAMMSIADGIIKMEIREASRIIKVVKHPKQAPSTIEILADQYKIERLLGQGGMGSVYLATDQQLGRQVAIRIMKAESSVRQNAGRFLREARSVARLNHPNIVTLYNYIWRGEQAYLVMEYASGATLSTIKSITVEEALDIAIKVAKALSYAHRQGVIHGDIKPGNIMIGDETQVMDFGLAKIHQVLSIPMVAARMGTPSYMAPEQALGKEVNEQSDVYSFGVVLYEMLTSRPPFSASDEVSLVSQHIQVTPVAPSLRNPSIPRSLDSLILKMLAKDPSKRPTSAEEVLQGLETARKELPATVRGETPSQKEMLSIDQARIEALRGIPLFASISVDDLSELSHKLTGRRYRKGEIIFHKDDVGSTLHIIKTGNVKISIPSEGEEDVILAYLRAGDFFGELALLDENPRSATVTAVEPTETLALERGDFLDFLKWYPDVAIRILAVQTQRLRNLNSQLENIIFFNPEARLAETLLKLTKTYGRETPEGWRISLPLTLGELAGMVGVTTATIRPLLRDLQASGIISAKNRRYTVRKPEELLKRAPRRTG